MKSLDKKIKKLPNEPGVYQFFNSAGELLYIGKATNLRDRVRSYFSVRLSDSRPVDWLIGDIADIKYQKTDSVLDALILEAAIVKKFQPKYNVKLKDDKSFLGIYITDEKVPRVSLARVGKKDLPAGSFYGPYTSAKLVRSALRIIRRIFPFCQTPYKPCFYRNLGLCPGICEGSISAVEYRRSMSALKNFLSGKKKKVIRDLERQMRRAADAEKFEEAARIKKQLHALRHIQDVALVVNEGLGFRVSDLGFPFRVEGYDISNISGKYAVGAMVVFENGQPAKNEYRKFKIKTVKRVNDIAMMVEIIRRRLTHREWQLPDVILADGGKTHVRAVRKIAKTIPVVGIAKGPTRKKNDLYVSAGDKKKIESRWNWGELSHIFPAIRDEAHRFAKNYHIVCRSRIL